MIDRVDFPFRMKVVALALFLLASCAGLQPRISSDLVGKWRYADRTQSCQYIFNRNGSFSGEVVYHARTISKFSGHWRVDGDNLAYVYLHDDLGRIASGTTDRDKLVAVAKDSFVIEAVDGKRRKYLRIR